MIRTKKTFSIAILIAALLTALLAAYLLNPYASLETLYPNGKIETSMNSITDKNKRVSCPPPLVPIYVNGELLEECFDPDQAKIYLTQLIEEK